MTYIDTSVLASYYCPEPLSGKAQRALHYVLHLAVAALQGCPLLTADVALAKAAAKIGATARLIS